MFCLAFQGSSLINDSHWIGAPRWGALQVPFELVEMKYGYIAFGKMKPDVSIDNVNKMMEEVKKVAEKHEVKVKMYGFPYGVSENFVAIYASDKGLDTYQAFAMVADLPYSDTRTHQVVSP